VPVPYSNPANVDPEEAFVAALSSCHMLTLLHVARKSGFVVVDYEDRAVGTMTKNERGVQWVSSVILHPRVAYGGSLIPSAADEDRLHHTAHDECYIANSVKTTIEVVRGISFVIRAEAPEDADGVRAVNELAFGKDDEARLVDSLRGLPGVISLVATEGPRVVGHILFTPVEIAPAPAADAAAGLGPMAVRPDRQRQGIGSALVRAGLRRCRDAGYGLVVVVGHPEYYPRFGFVVAATRNLRCEWTVLREAFMIVEFRPGACPGGVVKYLPQFGSVGD
jgi:putative acetyltransferase